MTPPAEDVLPAPGEARAPLSLVPDAAPDAGEAEAAAWAEVLAAWDDEARHRAYLARFADLEGLATAGGRDRAFLAERPGDAVAARFRDEVLRRAVAHGLASLPREPDGARARLALRAAAFSVIGGLLAFVGYLAVRLLVGWGAHP